MPEIFEVLQNYLNIYINKFTIHRRGYSIQLFDQNNEILAQSLTRGYCLVISGYSINSYEIGWNRCAFNSSFHILHNPKVTNLGLLICTSVSRLENLNGPYIFIKGYKLSVYPPLIAIRTIHL
jgi:hypothetical protein